MAERVRRRFIVPEVVQTSVMDCGPASVTCLLEGYGIHASYGRLREACQTDVDGTSIDTIEDVAVQLGLRAEQIVIPVDHVLVAVPSVLPAIAIVRLPNGVTHFVVIWRSHGPIVQVMDPATGRRWMNAERLLNDLYVHEATISADTWREWAARPETVATIRRRLSRVGVRGRKVDTILDGAAADSRWRTLATADAAGRMTTTLVRSRGVAPGQEAARTFERLYEHTLERYADPAPLIPRSYWSAWPAGIVNGSEQVALRGAVLVTIGGLTDLGRAHASASSPSKSATSGPLSRELLAALEEPRVRPWKTLFTLLKADGLTAAGMLLVALAAAAIGVIVEALLFRGLLGIGFNLALSGQRAVAAAMIVTFATALLLLELPIVSFALRIGRRIESRLRMAFLEKIPRLGDRYFHSRPTSDMAERSHSIHQIRLLPDLTAQLLRALFELLLTAFAIAWIDPPSAAIALLSATAALAIPLLVQPALQERDLRVRTHEGALGRFYLDAFLGLVAVRAHVAERALRREHETLLVEWAHAGLGLQRTAVVVEGAQLTAGFGLAAWLLLARFGRGGEPALVLLLAYWALNLPVLGQEVAQIAWQYPVHRNLMLRLLEPLGAIDDDNGERGERASRARTEKPAGVDIACDRVLVRAGGHTILEDITISIPAGSHVAIVGASGAGKSSLVGLLLGWHRPADGQVLVDNEVLHGAKLAQLRRETAWVDPAVQLWNRSLVENLKYGTDLRGDAPIAAAIDSAGLRDVLERLTDGLQTRLGEGGGLISGGEGQRVRLGRALLRPDARLVILDEPFRGLERERRRTLLRRARTMWTHATVLCITHDVSETLTFDRVLVVAQGRIVEDGDPAKLAADAGSRYRALVDAEAVLTSRMLGGIPWRLLRLDGGRLVEVGAEQPT